MQGVDQLLRFLRAAGEGFTLLAIIGILPVLAFMLWLIDKPKEENVILGKPVDLWINAVQAIWAVLAVLANIPGSPFTGLAVYLTPVVWGVVALALSAVGALAAYQPPTLAVGDQYSIQTPKGQPNYTATVALPPAPTTPVPEGTPGTE